jgi:hypothetical protein
MHTIAKDEDFAVSSLEVATFLMSIGLELRLDIL